MDAVDTLQDEARRRYRELKRMGLNPFDLFCWDALANLWVTLVYAGRAGKYESSTFHQHTKKQVWAALERKAEAIDIDSGDDDAERRLEELKRL